MSEWAAQAESLSYALPAKGLPGILGRALQTPFYLGECAQAHFGHAISELADIRVVSTITHGLPSHGICWLARIARLRPSPEVVCYLVSQPHFKYLAAYFAIFLRMTMRGVGVYRLLEPLYQDPRRLLVCFPGEGNDGIGPVSGDAMHVLHFDEFVELLLASDSFLGIRALPLRPRRELEARGFLSPLIDVLLAQPRSDYLRDHTSSENETMCPSGASKVCQSEEQGEPSSQSGS